MSVTDADAELMCWSFVHVNRVAYGSCRRKAGKAKDWQSFSIQNRRGRDVDFFAEEEDEDFRKCGQIKAS